MNKPSLETYADARDAVEERGHHDLEACGGRQGADVDSVTVPVVLYGVGGVGSAPGCGVVCGAPASTVHDKWHTRRWACVVTDEVERGYKAWVDVG